MVKADLIIIGGGLAGTLTALRCRQKNPGARILLVEKQTRLGGNHTWSFHASDLPPAALQWVRPLTTAQWSGYEVRFPGLSRSFAGNYYSIRSEDLHSKAVAELGDALILGASAVRVSENSVEVPGHGLIRADLVLDARGIAWGPNGVGGYQKFLGQVLQLEAPHGLRQPLLMDATVAQTGGFRFIYVLPLAADQVLVEDTRYSTSPEVAPGAFRSALSAYCVSREWRVKGVLDEETGSLPIPLSAALPWVDGGAALGMRAGLFHPTTGYSLPDVVAAAENLAVALQSGKLPSPRGWAKRCRREWSRRWFFRYLNRMLFSAQASRRYLLLERFHRLPSAVVQRFYSGRLKPWDIPLVLLWGKPPVPVFHALRLIAQPKESHV